jgi:hypothetical protein
MTRGVTPLSISRSAWRYIVGIAIVVLIAAAVGFLTDRTFAFVAAALFVLLVLQVRNLLRLDKWLSERATVRPPDMGGLWGEVVAVVSRIYRRKVFHKRRVLGEAGAQRGRPFGRPQIVVSDTNFGGRVYGAGQGTARSAEPA